MFNIAKIDHLNISVTNLEQTIVFYKKVFNLEVKEEFENGVIIGNPNSFYLALYPLKNSEVAELSRQMVNHFGVHIDNFEHALEKVIDAGIEISYGDNDYVDYAKSRSLYITDPNGIQIELSEHFGGALN